MPIAWIWFIWKYYTSQISNIQSLLCMSSMFRPASNRRNHYEKMRKRIWDERTTYFCILQNISHPWFWSNLKATAKWWFSNTDSSLYINASSEPVVCDTFLVVRRREAKKTVYSLAFRFICACVFQYCVRAWINFVQIRLTIFEWFQWTERREWGQYLLELIKNWLVKPGWSTSWIQAANNAPQISIGVKTPSNAGVFNRTLVLCVTSAACIELWNGLSLT